MRGDAAMAKKTPALALLMTVSSTPNVAAISGATPNAADVLNSMGTADQQTVKRMIHLVTVGVCTTASSDTACVWHVCDAGFVSPGVCSISVVGAESMLSAKRGPPASGRPCAGVMSS